MFKTIKERKIRMPSKTPRFTLRIDPELMKKFRYVAERHYLSANKEAEKLIKAHVEAYEKEHGPINADK